MKSKAKKILRKDALQTIASNNIRGKAAREAGTSQHHGGSIKGPRGLRILGQYDDKEFKGALNWASIIPRHYNILDGR